MSEDLVFIPFPKLGRLNRNMVVTEKLDGTNACIIIALTDAGITIVGAQSRNKMISTVDDNHGFAKFVEANKEELIVGLGYGRHFGEWWGPGVNKRKYGLKEKKFSLFNTKRWASLGSVPKDGHAYVPACCDVVPVLYEGIFDTNAVHLTVDKLVATGSIAAPGCMDPEGVVIYHTGADVYFKMTVKNDETPKSLVAMRNPEN